MKFYVTNDEIEALKLYKGFNYESINQMLIGNSESDIAVLSDETEKNKISISYSKDDVKRYIEIVKKVYELIQKVYYSKASISANTFFRGTNLSEIERIKNEPYIDRFLSATDNAEDAKELYASTWNRPAILEISNLNNVSFIDVNEILNDTTKKEYIISPFTTVKEIQEEEELTLEFNSKSVKKYKVILENQELEQLSQDERKGLYTYILNTADEIDSRLDEIMFLEKTNSENYENIRKLEQLLSKYEIEAEKPNPQVDYDDIERINKQLNEIKNECSAIFKEKKDLINFVTNWKRNIVLYLMSECEDIARKYRDITFEENITEEVKQTEEIIKDINEEKSETLNYDTVEFTTNISESSVENNITEKQEENFVDIEENIIQEEQKDTEVIVEEQEEIEINNQTKKECYENIESAEKLLENIKNLISKQQNHAKIAGNLGTTYSALNNGFEMKKITENLIILLRNIKLKVDQILAEEKDENVLNEKLNEISKVNLQIGTLFNYLNNPKNSIGISNITRFDEMAIIEENELKRGIYQTVRDIIGEAELKKLKDDLEIIEEKTPIERLMGIFTGKNKLDEIMLEQIEIRQNAIRKTLAQKVVLAKNYSIHEIIAKIKMFIKENYDDSLVDDEVADLESLDKELRNNFVILDSKVESIISEREGRNLPIDNNKKISKRESLEIDTYRFLNKYGYDLKEENSDVKYQDTMTSEISRIIEYINSSKII